MIEAPVLVRVENGVGRITLNRPGALHALTHRMCLIITAALRDFANDPAIGCVLIDHAGERGFCAGGDIRMLAESGAGDGEAAKGFFFDEYRLNHLMFVFPKPMVAVVDGVVMGGGVGVSDPAKYRIATEHTTYAMPETGIGLFPDVGGGWFLPRLPGQTGVWLGLTGARLKSADTVGLGVHTHFISSTSLDAFKADLLSGESPQAALARHAEPAGPSPLIDRREAIDRLFAFNAVEDIVAALQAEGGDWAQAQLAALKIKSPQALKVTLRLLRQGAKAASFAENMALEYALAGRVVRTHDFQEGVRAAIIDKDHAPRWSPADLAGVTPQALDALFAPLPADQAWTPLA